jgi:GT2 family glycosyltransferase
MPPLVSIVVVLWNSASHVPALAATIASQTHPALEVVVVDNGSADAGLELLRAALPDCLAVRNAANLGFARACNQGIDVSAGQYVLLLNHDVQLDPRFLEILVALMEDRPEVGWCSGKLVRPPAEGGKIRIDSAGEVIKRNRRVVNRGEGEVDCGQYDQAEPVFGVSAAAALYRRAMLDECRVDGEVLV